jgi:hypothetical protein
MAAQQPAQAAVPQQFYLSPWDGDLDLSTKTGKALWDEGIRPLENKFSGEGRDLVRFLADVSIRVDKCKWEEILTFNGKFLLTHYGDISIIDVMTARTIRDQAIVSSLTDARPKINALMLFHFVYDSLGPLPQKKLSTKLTAIKPDGPLLLKTVLDQTFVATQSSTYAIKERFYELSLKKYKWNVQALNQDVREKLADLVAAGHASDETDIMISLFRAYKTASNEEFLHAVEFWKNEWNTKIIQSVEQLMVRADGKYAELRDLGTWAKRSPKDDQIIALTARLDSLQNKTSGNQGTTIRRNDKQNSSIAPKWKYDRTASTTKELKKNNKVYKWCTGPGHHNLGMWVLHEPGKCTVANKSEGNKSHDSNKLKQQKAHESNMSYNTQDNNSRTVLTALLKEKGFADNEAQSKMDAILAVLDS